MCFICISLYFLYAFMVYLRPVSRTHNQFKALFKGDFLIHSFVFPSIFLRFCWSIYLRRLYACGSIFKCCQCIITAPVNNHCTYWRTNPLLTKHWLIKGTSVSVYIDHVTYFNRTTIVTNLTRAYNTIRIPCPETRLFRVPFKWYKQK